MRSPTAKVCARITLVASLLVIACLGGCPGLPGSGSGTGAAGFNVPPTPVITTDLTRGVSPLTVQFNSERSTDDGMIVSREWDFGDGETSSEIAPRHTFQTTGDFVVTLTLTDDDGQSASATVTISVTDAPVAIISADPTSAESAPALVTFDGSESYDPDGEIVSYRWDFGDGSREYLETVSHVFVSSGTYRVRLTVTDDKGVTGYSEVLISVGIKTPRIELRTPGDEVRNLVITPDSPLWVQGVFEVEPGVPYFITAGLDRDRDPCEARTVSYTMAAGDELLTCDGQDDRITSVAYSPDGTMLATASDDGSVWIYETTRGTRTGVFNTDSRVKAVAFSPDGTQIVWGEDDGDVVLADVATATVVRTFTGHGGAVQDVAFAPDASSVFSAGADRHALMWNIADGTVLRDFEHTLAVNAVAYSPTDDELVATAGEDGLIKLWNVTSGTLLRTINGHTEAVNDLVFSPDGLALVSASDDNRAIAWEPYSGTLVFVYTGHEADVLAVDISPDGAYLVTGAADWTARVWNTATGEELFSVQPCRSPITSVAVAPDGTRFAAGVGARNDIPLDTRPSSGNDLDITVLQALSLQQVPALDGLPVPAGRYYVWAEVDTDRSDPVRDYAACEVNVLDSFTPTVATDTPMIPLVSGEANVVVPFEAPRQVFDLGLLEAGTRVTLALMHIPGYDTYYVPEYPYSVMLLDSVNEIVAWYQAIERTAGSGVLLPDLHRFVLFTRDTDLVIGHTSIHHYVVVDGPVSVKIKVDRSSTMVPKHPQRVLVQFNGGEVGVGGQPVQVIPPFDAGALKDGWGASETTTIKQVVLARLNNIFADYDIEFYSSDDATPPTPYLTVYIGQQTPDGYLGIADYVDPRNQTATGSAIVYALEIAQRGFAGQFSNLLVTDGDVGNAIANVAAHVVGQMIGLRNTSDPTDIMQGGDIFDIGDPTIPRILKAASPAASEQYDSLPPIGIQNAPRLLEETIGRR